MKRVYTSEQRDFLFEFIPGHSLNEIVKAFNSRFQLQITPEMVHSFKSNNHVRSGTKKGNPPDTSWLFPHEIRVFIRENNTGKTLIQITELVNKEFGTNYSTQQIKSLRQHMHIISGLSGRFKPGHVPLNKGVKGWFPEKAKEHWFKKNHIPHNRAKVGTEVMSSGGYLKIKIAEPNIWRFKHIMEWEKYNGKVPPGYFVSFKDGNHYNCDISNLMLITPSENAIMNTKKLRSVSSELTETGLVLAKLEKKIKDIKRS